MSRDAERLTEVVPGIAALDRRSDPVFVVVGVFDGLHRGHAYLLRHLRLEAARRAARPTVVTFDHHPDEIVLGSAPPLLCDLDERVVRLGAAGVALTVVQHFDVALRMTEYDAFVETIRERTPVTGFLMTPDAAFGHERRGTPSAVAALGERDGFDVVVVPPLDLDGLPVRSSAVRAAVAAGDLASVRHLMGRPLAVVGDVDGPAARASARVSDGAGDAAVRFPIPFALPPDGTYAATVEPAWQPRSGRVAEPRRTEVDVAEGRVLLSPRSARAAGPDRRIRVAFVRRGP